VTRIASHAEARRRAVRFGLPALALLLLAPVLTLAGAPALGLGALALGALAQWWHLRPHLGRLRRAFDVAVPAVAVALGAVALAMTAR